MITPITATFPALNFPKEVDYPTQEDWADFSAEAELNYGILSGAWSDKSEEFKEQTNNLALEIQEIGENAFNAISLNTIEDLATYTSTGLVMIKDINRGGTFVSKTATEIDLRTGNLYVVNNGTVFAKLGGGFWVREYSGSVNVKWFGAIGDFVPTLTHLGTNGNGTDNTVAFNNAVSCGVDVYIPSGWYKIGTVVIDKPIRIYGGNMANGVLVPIEGSRGLVIASDHVTISDLEFRGKNGTGQANINASCITIDAYTYNNSITRHVEGVKINRVKFRNITANGIYCPHLLRESYITECRFIGVGSLAQDNAPIKFHQLYGSPSVSNVIHIKDNIFYRFDMPCIYGLRSSLVGALGSLTAVISGNLFHGQLQNESAIPVGYSVVPEPTNHIYIEDGAVNFFSNDLTSVHPAYKGIYVANVGVNFSESKINNNSFNVKSNVGGVIYSQTVAPLSNGNFVKLLGLESMNVSGNSMYGGVFIEDVYLDNGDYTTPVRLSVIGNTSTAGTLSINVSNTYPYEGIIEYDTTILTNKKTIYTKKVAGNEEQVIIGNSIIELNSSNTAGTAHNIIKFTDLDGSSDTNQPFGSIEFYSLDQSVGSTGLKAYIRGIAETGNPKGSIVFGTDALTGTATDKLILTSTGVLKPANDGTQSNGTAANRWSTIYASTGTINTSDDREKTYIDITKVEKEVALELKANMRKFKFNNSIEEKGEDKARIHFGTSAQTVKSIFEKHGLVAENYSILCYDEWENQEEVKDEQGNIVQEFKPSGNRYGLRYEELLSFIIGCI